jgi:hypothetical protein
MSISNPTVAYLASQSGMDSSFSEEDDEISFKAPVVVVSTNSAAGPTVSSPSRADRAGDLSEEEAPRSLAVDIHTSSAMFRRENEALSKVQETDEDREHREEEERLKREVWAEVEKVRQERQKKEEQSRKQRLLVKRRAKARQAAGGGTPSKTQNDEGLSEKALELRRKREADRAKFRELRRQKQQQQQQATSAAPGDGFVIAVAGGSETMPEIAAPPAPGELFHCLSVCLCFACFFHCPPLCCFWCGPFS